MAVQLARVKVSSGLEWLRADGLGACTVARKLTEQAAAPCRLSACLEGSRVCDSVRHRSSEVPRAANTRLERYRLERGALSQKRCPDELAAVRH